MLGGVLRETEFIRSLTGIGELEENSKGIGDDAALLGGCLISKDIMAEGVHYLLEETEAGIARRLIASNVSDICAMGGKGEKYYALLGAGLSCKINPAAFSAAFRKECRRYNITLLGGDTIASPVSFFSMTIIGQANRFVLTRCGAKMGDIIYLSRPIGKAKVMLDRRLSGDFSGNGDFPPETGLGELLGSMEGVTSCIDISDGLGVDLFRVSEMSETAFHLSAEDIPLGAEGIAARDAVCSGEEYALMFTLSQDRSECLENAVKEKLNRKVYRIGKVLQGLGVFMDGEDISELGYRHKLG